MRNRLLQAIVLLWLSIPVTGQSQDGSGEPTSTRIAVNSSLPVIVKFNARLQEPAGTITSGLRGITVSLYKDQTGGVPLWTETQTAPVDSQGRFMVLLGSTTAGGIPASAFASGDPRWVGIMLDDGVERPRIELTTVPYAFKAADADTLGGKNSDDFVSREQLNSLLNVLKLPTPIPMPPISFPQPGIASTFEATAPSGPSIVSDATIGPPLQVQSEVMVPHLNADLLHGVSDSAFAKLLGNNLLLGSQTFAAGIDMPPSNLEPNTTNLLDSATLDFESSSPGPSGNAVLTKRFRWASQSLAPASNGPAARLSLFFGVNGANPSPTGLFFNSDGTINFAPGQQFPSSAVLAAIADGSSNGATGRGAGTNNPIVNTANYPWVQEPISAAAIVAGQNAVTLTPCPRGLNGSDAWHYLYLSGTGTPEVVLLTGGSCVSRAKSGTIEFTATYAHPPGFSIGTATAGLQEAVNDADRIKTAGQISRQVLIDPGAHLLRARVSVRSSSMTIISSGATLTCAMSDTCIMLGDPSNANAFGAIVLQGLRVAPGVREGTWPAVEDNAQGSQITDFAPAVSSIQFASFGYMVQVDNDQAAVLHGINITPNYAWGRCDTTFCSTAILGPGPYSKNAGVLTVEDSTLSMQCGGNGVDNNDGNTLKVTNTTVQGFAQFGIRASTVYRNDTVTLSGIYWEEDSNCNPLGTGSTGLIVEGGQATALLSPTAGLLPVYVTSGSIGLYYYIVVHSSTLGTSPTYIAGRAATNGSGPIKVLWNQVGSEGVITYDVLRISGDGGADMSAPYGTGPFAVAVGVPATQCTNRVCSVVDDAASSPSSYTVADNTPYWPSLKLWPGTLILTSAKDMQNSGGGNPTTFFTSQLLPGTIVNSAGNTYPSVFAQECDPQGNWTSIWMQCLGGNSVGNDWPAVTATLLQLSNSGGALGGLKGRLNFELPPGAEVGPTHVITLSDSNPDKTLATPNNRPTWDANDSYIGYDEGSVPSKMGISLGSPVSISRYIGNPGDGTSYRERLTATQEQYQVPVTYDPVPFLKLPNAPDGSVVYCIDCENVADDEAVFDSNAVGGGHGTNLLHENGHWRIH